MFQLLSRHTRCSNRQVENLCNRCSYRPFILCLVSENHVVCHNPCLSVGWSCQIVEPCPAMNRMRIFYCIAYGIDIAGRGLQVFVNFYSSCAQLNACIGSKSGVRSYAYRKQNHVCLYLLAAAKVHAQPAARLAETLYPTVKIEVNTLVHQFAMHTRSHREVYRRHHLRSHLYDCNMYASMMKILCHLQTDESSSHHYSPLNAVAANVCLNLVGIFHVAQRENAFAANAFQRRYHRIGTRRKQQLVVSLRCLASVFHPQPDGFFTGIHSHSLSINPYVNLKAPAKRFGCLHKELVSLCYYATYIIRQSAVGIRDIRTFLYQHYFCTLVSTPYSRCCCGSSCHSSYYYMFHFLMFFLCFYSLFYLFMLLPY